MPQNPHPIADAVEKRPEFLSTVISNPGSKRDLETRFGCSRSTLDRALRELADAGLVDYDDGMWQATALGRRAYEQHEQYHRRLDDLDDATTILSATPDRSPVGPDVLFGSRVVEPDPAMPDWLMRTLLESVRDATRVSVVLPVVMTGYIEEFCTATTSGEDHLEAVVARNATDSLRRRSTDTLSTLREEASLYRGDVSQEFGFWMADDREMGVMVFGDHGPCGLLVNDTDDALAWADDRFERERSRAEPLSAVSPDQPASQPAEE